MATPAVTPAVNRKRDASSLSDSSAPKAKKKKVGAQFTALAIQAVKSKGQGLTFMMASLIGGKAISLPDGTPFTVATLVSEWNNGGKQILEGTWRQDANKPTGHSVPKADFDPEQVGVNDEQYEEELGNGLHEWIPTNMLAYVIDNAVSNKDETKALQWLMAAEALRIPTRFVILKPGRVQAMAASKPGAKAPVVAPKATALSGHVGALYLQDAKSKAYKQQTKGQGPFHDELRAILRRNLSAQKSDIAAYRQELLNYIQSAFWQGEPLPGVPDTDPCPYFYNSGVNTFASWGANIGEMRATLAAGWATHNQVLTNLWAAVLPIHRTNIPYCYTARHLDSLVTPDLNG